MTSGVSKNRLEWSMAKADLCREVRSLGFPVEFADLLAKELGSPRAISRMTAYLRCTKPHSVEMIVDEMLAIFAEVKAWREKKESEEAQASYNAYLYERRINGEDDDQDHICMSWKYLSKPDGGVCDEGHGSQKRP